MSEYCIYIYIYRIHDLNPIHDANVHSTLMSKSKMSSRCRFLGTR